jgi:hypothetical protein
MAANLVDELESPRVIKMIPARGSGIGWAPPHADDPRLVDLDQLAHGHVDGRAELFALQSLRWSEDGKIRTCPRYRSVSLPASVGARAVALGAAKLPGDPECRQLALSHAGSRVAMGDKVVDLDEPVTEAVSAA